MYNSEDIDKGSVYNDSIHNDPHLILSKIGRLMDSHVQQWGHWQEKHLYLANFHEIWQTHDLNITSINIIQRKEEWGWKESCIDEKASTQQTMKFGD